jgi:outer membrane autotransporter protein
MQPSAFTSLAVAQENALFYIRNTIDQHFEDLARPCLPFPTKAGFTRVDSPEESFWTVWVAGLDAHTSQQTRHQEPGFIANSPGTFMGVDYRLAHHVEIGGGLGYTYTHLHWKEARGNAQMQTAYASLYGRWLTARGFLQGALLGGYNLYSIHRHIKVGGALPFEKTARSHHQGIEGAFHVKGGLSYTGFIGKLIPFLSLDYLILHEEGFRETGAQSLDLHVKSKSSDLLTAEAGLDFSHCFSTESASYTPFVKASVIREERFRGRHENASLKCGCDFTVKGLYPSRTLAGVAAGLTAAFSGNFLSLSYQGKFNAHYNDNSFYLEYTRRF